MSQNIRIDQLRREFQIAKPRSLRTAKDRTMIPWCMTPSNEDERIVEKIATDRCLRENRRPGIPGYARRRDDKLPWEYINEGHIPGTVNGGAIAAEFSFGSLIRDTRRNDVDVKYVRRAYRCKSSRERCTRQAYATRRFAVSGVIYIRRPRIDVVPDARPSEFALKVSIVKPTDAPVARPTFGPGLCIRLRLHARDSLVTMRRSGIGRGGFNPVQNEGYFKLIQIVEITC